MIIKERTDWLRLLFHYKGSSLEKTWPRILSATVVAVAVTYADVHSDIEKFTLTTTPFTLIGVALGIFLGFRNNAAYDRFWEGRKLWGSLVNTSRSLARQAYSLIDAPGNDQQLNEFRRKFIRRVIAFVHAFRFHLRDDEHFAEIEKFLSPEDTAEIRQTSHRPMMLLQQLGRDLAYAREQKWLHELNVPFVDSQLVELSNILGGCERIKNTPIPFAYTLLIHRTVAIYCLALPFGLIDLIGTLTPVVVFLISYSFFGLDDIGDEIEEPFGTEPNHLPLTTISRNIEINLLEILQDPDRPEPWLSRNGVLI